jgi:hypothetical protein
MAGAADASRPRGLSPKHFDERPRPAARTLRRARRRRGGFRARGWLRPLTAIADACGRQRLARRGPARGGHRRVRASPRRALNRPVAAAVASAARAGTTRAGAARFYPGRTSHHRSGSRSICSTSTPSRPTPTFYRLPTLGDVRGAGRHRRPTAS